MTLKFNYLKRSWLQLLLHHVVISIHFRNILTILIQNTAPQQSLHDHLFVIHVYILKVINAACFNMCLLHAVPAHKCGERNVNTYIYIHT